jgi:hypothetical protein
VRRANASASLLVCAVSTNERVSQWRCVARADASEARKNDERDRDETASSAANRRGANAASGERRKTRTRVRTHAPKARNPK